ncbi:MAG: hypothetical protein WC831_05550 [Parcubacteria group bacterium]
MKPEDLALQTELVSQELIRPVVLADVLGHLDPTRTASTYCGDGRTNIASTLQEVFEPFNHFAIFGGPVFLTPSFKGFDMWLADCLLKNIRVPVEEMPIDNIVAVLHYPCAVICHLEQNLLDTYQMFKELPGAIKHSGLFKGIFPFLHIKSTERGVTSQVFYELGRKSAE